VRQSFSHGRTKQVAVEVREKRSINRPGAAGAGRAGSAWSWRAAADPHSARCGACCRSGRACRAEVADRLAASPMTRRVAARRRCAARWLSARRAKQRQRAEEDQRRALEDAQRKKAAEACRS
jgi:translation initiation factor IF-2